MSQGCALWMSESKCQRSRSQCSDYWKWFLAHNCCPFTSAIIKRHAQIPCESRICLTDIGVKNLRSLNWLPRGVLVPLGQPYCSSDWKATATNRMNSNDLEACRMMCYCVWLIFHVFRDLFIMPYFKLNAICIKFYAVKCLIYIFLWFL